MQRIVSVPSYKIHIWANDFRVKAHYIFKIKSKIFRNFSNDHDGVGLHDGVGEAFPIFPYNLPIYLTIPFKKHLSNKNK